MALRQTTDAVKIIIPGAPAYRLPAAVAARMAQSGSFIGYGTKQRVKCIREEDRRVITVDTHYLDGRAVLRYHTGQRSRDKEMSLVDCWTRIFANQANTQSQPQGATI